MVLLPVFSMAQIKHDYLISRMNASVLLEDTVLTNLWGYGRYNTGTAIRITLPGPLLRYYTNDSVVIHFWNDSPEHHTIHLHGLDANQANDGVPSTSFPILQNDSTTYSFKALYPGTYLYHCHVTTTLHLAMGMYGMLVVDHPNNLMYQNGPGYNKDYAFLSSDMDRSWNDMPTSPGPFHEYEANYFMVNGKSGLQLFTDTSQIMRINAGDSVLLRLANVGYTISEYCFPIGTNPVIHMSDGRVLPSPVPIDTLKIYPGERYSILLKPTTFIADYICVSYIDMFNDNQLGTNFIGINQNYHPNSVYEMEISDWKIFPNPTENIIFIESNQYKENERIYFYNIQGQLVYTYKLSSTIEKIDLSFLESGIYILKSDQREKAYKLIVK